MTFDPASIKHTVNPWFTKDLDAEGTVRVELTDPKGVLEGQGKVVFAGYQPTIELQIDSYQSSDPDHEGLPSLMSLLVGGKPVVKDGKRVYRMGGFDNPCRSIIVNLSGGKYHTEGRILSAGGNFNFTGEQKTVVRYKPEYLWYTSQRSNAPEFWVCPVANFLSEFFMSHSDLDHHPLRIWPKPSIPQGLAESDAKFAKQLANQNNRLIVFTYGKDLTFIERLPTYTDSERQLQRKQLSTAITAVMIGRISGRSIATRDEVAAWCPAWIDMLLSMASGTHVGLPWIEFRDATGCLVSRLHWRRRVLPWNQGYAPISGHHHASVGQLLTEALAGAEIEKPYIRAAIQHLLRASPSVGTLDDQLQYVFTALDCLVGYHGQARQSLLPELPAEIRSEVSACLRDSRARLESLVQQMRTTGNTSAVNALNQIHSRLGNVANIDRDFGVAVVNLLTTLGLHDAEALSVHFTSHPRLDRKTWPQVLSVLRNAVVHDGYIDFDALGADDVGTVFKLKTHLVDIVTRIILKRLGYSGMYHPHVSPYHTEDALHWVTAATSGRSLGYEGEPMT